MQVPGAVPPPAVLGGVAAGVLAPAVPRVLRPLVEKAKEKQLSLMDQKSCAGQLVLS
jgi:carbohydrate-binding DOMON domain-containing protein